MKSKTRFIIINESTNFHKSFIINQYSKIIISLILIILIILASWGLYRIIKPHKKQTALNQNISLKYNTINLLNHLINSGIVDSTILNEFHLNNNHNKIIPKIMPVKGIVTKGISHSNEVDHFGIDIAATLNSDIKSTQEGMVVFASDFNEYGKTVIIAHPNNYFSLYSHLNTTNVKQRDYVSAGQIIGTIGESGKSDGPHLHFEIWKNNVIIDPRELIQEYKVKDVSIK